MLVLTRKLGESIIIGNEITVKVVGISGNQIKLGIDAPVGVPVHREEVYERIKEENLSASRIFTNIEEIDDIFEQGEN